MIPDFILQEYDGPVHDDSDLPDGRLFGDREPLVDPDNLSPEDAHHAISQWTARHGERESLGDGLFTGLHAEYESDRSHHLVDVRCLSEDPDGERTYMVCLTKLVCHENSDEYATVGWEDQTMVRTENIRRLLRRTFISFSEVSS